MQVGGTGYGMSESQDSRRVQGSLRLHRVLRRCPHDTVLRHKARAKVFRHQFPVRHPKFPQCQGNTQPICSLADKGFSGCRPQGKQVLGLRLSWCFCSSVVHAWVELTQPQLCPAPQEHAASLGKKWGSLLSHWWCGLRGQKARRSQGAS